MEFQMYMAAGQNTYFGVVLASQMSFFFFLKIMRITRFAHTISLLTSEAIFLRPHRRQRCGCCFSRRSTMRRTMLVLRSISVILSVSRPSNGRNVNRMMQNKIFLFFENRTFYRIVKRIDFTTASLCTFTFA